jgi:hypothetical protein
MRKLTILLMVVSLVLSVVAVAAAANLPQALKGVDLTAAKQVADNEAQNVRGAAQGPANPTPGTCICTTTTCIPNNYLSPGPHKK